MKSVPTKLADAVVLEPDVHRDHRGYFMETYSLCALDALGITSRFVQDNESYTKRKGTLRGIHFQIEPMAQAKIVRVTSGAALDVAVDLRRGSPTYLQWIAEELSARNKRMIYLPKGFGHGFLTLTDDVVFCYKTDRPYSEACDRSIRFDDPSIGVAWGIDDPVLSEKDRLAPLLKDSDCCFVYPS